MSYTTPTTKTAGQNLTAADWNTSIVANLEALAKRPACALERNTSQDVSAGDPIEFTTERVDTHNLHSTSSNTSRVTIPADWPGIWLICGASQAPNIQIRVNGTTIRARGDHSVTGLVNLAAADYVEITVVNAATIAGAQMSAIWMRATP